MEKKLYILFNELGRVVGENYFSVGEQPELSTDILPTKKYIVSCFNRETNEYYEGATQEEILEYNKKHAPFSVTKRQLKQSLFLNNIPLELIDSTIANIADNTERILMKLYWEESYEFERNHPKLVDFAQKLNISDAQVDELFIFASNL